MNKNIKNDILVFVVVLIPAFSLFCYNVELYGDIFQFLALYLGLFVLIYERNFKRAIMLIIASIFVVCFVYAIKKGFVLLALNDAIEYAKISLRPKTNDYDGFPSGHTAAAFIAVGYAIHFYSKKWVILLTLIAIFVPQSRVITLWHTPLQVLAGGLFGLFITYFVILLLKKNKYFSNI